MGMKKPRNYKDNEIKYQYKQTMKIMHGTARERINERLMAGLDREA
jgi:hypothetical protein